MHKLEVLYRYVRTMRTMATMLPTYIPQYNQAVVEFIVEYESNIEYYDNLFDLYKWFNANVKA